MTREQLLAPKFWAESGGAVGPSGGVSEGWWGGATNHYLSAHCGLSINITFGHIPTNHPTT
jgi:hypothetical protein